MTDTPHLGLPLLAAAQAQKHVTHNEALALLDAAVHLAALDRRAAPPPSPAAGDRHLVLAGATGAFAGQEGTIALFDAGAWRFLDPRPGWRLYVASDDAFLVHDGTEWRDLGHILHELDGVTRLGIGMAPDAANRLAAKLGTALLTAETVAEGGSGDLRLVLNKEAVARVGALLFQNAFSARAEIGLIGDDDLRLRVSPNGTAWRDGVRVARQTGEVLCPAGVVGSGGLRNLLVNGLFRVNQRGFPGGSLAAGAYGFDRWKAGAGGCTLSRAADGTVTLNGALTQVIEEPGLAGLVVTLSVENPSAAITVTVAGVTATIPAGNAIRRQATVTVPAGATGDVAVTLSAPGVSFARPVLNVGPLASPFEHLPHPLVLALCQRYFAKTFAEAQIPAANAGLAGALAGSSGAAASGATVVPWRYPVPMRAIPAVTTYNPSAAGAGFWTSAGTSVAASVTGGATGCLVATAAASAHPAVHHIHAVADAEL